MLNTVLQNMSSILSKVVVVASQWMLVVGKGIIKVDIGYSLKYYKLDNKHDINTNYA